MAREILIADSDTADQEEFERIFKSTDYRVVFSENSEEAFFSIRLMKPDVVIAGLALSEKTGFELCEAVKKDPDLTHIPFVLLSGIFEDIPEQEQKRVGANGVLSKPLVGDEVLTLVNRLVTKEAAMTKDGEFAGGAREWKSFAGMRTEELSLTNPDDLDEEIIELVDVVEESMSRMTIDDFVSPSREEPGNEIPPIEPWARSFEEVVGAGMGEKAAGDRKPTEEELLSLEPIAGGVAESAPTDKEAKATESELFEKIELEEIFQKVETLKPQPEKEQTPEMEAPQKTEMKFPEGAPLLKGDWVQEASRQEASSSVDGLSVVEDAEKKPMGFDEFEALMRKSLEIGSLEDEDMAPLPFEEGKEAPAERVAEEKPPVKEETLEQLAEEIEAIEGRPVSAGKAPEPFLLDEFEELLKKEPEPEEAQVQGWSPPLDEALPELKEEEFPEALLEELEEEIDEETPEEGQVGAIETLPEEEFLEEDLLEEELDVLKEFESPEEIGRQRAIAPAAFMAQQAIAPTELPAEEEAVSFKEMKKGVPPLEEGEKVITPSEGLKDAVASSGKIMDRKSQEVIAGGIQVMIGDFITKILPEMTQNILDVTAERIEQMVKEIVPEMAEKAIREEIKRFQKEDKES